MVQWYQQSTNARSWWLLWYNRTLQKIIFAGVGNLVGSSLKRQCNLVLSVFAQCLQIGYNYTKGLHNCYSSLFVLRWRGSRDKTQLIVVERDHFGGRDFGGRKRFWGIKRSLLTMMLFRIIGSSMSRMKRSIFVPYKDSP